MKDADRQAGLEEPPRSRCIVSAPDDNREFVRLLIEHEDELLRFILPLVGCFDDAREVLQNTSVALWDKFSQYQAAQPFLPWARQFARYEVLKHHKRSSRYLFYTPEIIESLIGHIEQHDMLAAQRQEALRHCLRSLPKPTRELVHLRYEQNLSVRDAAAQLGRTEGALYQALSRVRRLLADCIQQKLSQKDMA
jgi:RNA polymerase sigma-70 factor (ECF subfamily)